MEVFADENFRGTGAGCAHSSRDELTGNKPRLVDQRTLAGTQVKKESLYPLKERAGNSGLQGGHEVMGGDI